VVVPYGFCLKMVKKNFISSLPNNSKYYTNFDFIEHNNFFTNYQVMG